MRYSKQIFKILFTLFIISIIIYGFYRLVPILEGPDFNVNNFKNGDVKEGTYLKIEGNSKNLTKLYLNGTLIDLSKRGNWESYLAMYPNNNIITIIGVDKFGREIKKTYNIYSK